MSAADPTPSLVAGSHPVEDRRGLRRVLVTLSTTQVVSWGVLYYAFPVLAGRISADTGWPLPTLAASFSAGLVMSALFGILVGRWLDRHGPRWLMTLGSVIAVAAVAGIAWAPTISWFVVAWMFAGIAMSAVLYPPAFAALTRWYGPQRIGALTMLTVAGGFASTIFAPISALLAGPLGWRGSYMVLAALLGVVTVPGHLIGLNRSWPPPMPLTEDMHRPHHVLRSRPFLALVAALALAICASHAVVVNLIPLLSERGVSMEIAAVTLGLGGAGQVVGRLGYGWLARRAGLRTRTTATLAGVAVTTALLAVLTSVAALILIAVLAGIVRGILTLLQATAVTDRWGASHYGQISGVLSAPGTMTGALAPWIGAALAAVLGGYPPMFWVMSGVAAVAAALGLASVPASPNSAQKPAQPRRPAQAGGPAAGSEQNRRPRLGDTPERKLKGRGAERSQSCKIRARDHATLVHLDRNGIVRSPAPAA